MFPIKRTVFLCTVTFGFPNSKKNSFRGNYMRKYSSRKPENYNGTIIFEIDIMKNSSPLNLKFTLFAMSKPKQQFFSAGLTALSAQLRVNQNKRNNQNNCEKVKFDKDLN